MVSDQQGVKFVCPIICSMLHACHSRENDIAMPYFVICPYIMHAINSLFSEFGCSGLGDGGGGGVLGFYFLNNENKGGQF